MKKQREAKFEEQLSQRVNCAQIVLAAFCEEYGLSQELAMKLTGGMGGGMSLGEKCGAVTAMFLVAGLFYGNFAGTDLEKKNELKEIVKALNQAFEQEFGCTDCKGLMTALGKGEIAFPETDRYRARPCTILMEKACDILEKQLQI